MSDFGLVLSGNEWQNWANQLLTMHYGPTNYVKIPDTEGDGGLEGFTRKEGHAYQAYGAEAGKTAKQLYEAQRNKMTRDIGTFISNQKVLSRLLGETKVSCWILFVPKIGLKDIIAHANSKTEEVKQAQLPYVTDEFLVSVCDEDSFAAERDRLMSYNSAPIFIDSETPNSTMIDDWASKNPDLIQTLYGKLSKLGTLSTEEKRQKFSRKVLIWHLEGQNLLSTLKELSPTVHENVWRAKNHYEKTLDSLQMGAPNSCQIFQTTLDEFQETLREVVKTLSILNSRSLAHEAVADWLLRCPLDFPNGEYDG